LRPGRIIRARLPRATFSPSRAHAVGYRTADDRWWLRWSCADCGGVEVPLAERPHPSDIEAMAQRLAGRRCPECETRRRRAALAVSGPTVWYDTRLDDWVLQLPGCQALLPLEIGGFDAPEVSVYRAASDIAHSGDALDGRLPE
jgi:hypothetical protein